MDLIATKNGSTTFNILFDKNNIENEVKYEEYFLILAPFSKTPKIDFGKVKTSKQTSRLLSLQNAQNFDLDMNISCKDLQIDNLKVNLPAKQTVSLEIKWQPEQEGNHKYSILFEVINAARLKFLVHAFGICLPDKTMIKRTIRKPLAQCQPRETSLNNKHNNKSCN